MNKTKMICALLIAGALGSCQKDEIGKSETEGAVGNVNFRLTASSGGPTFRTGHSDAGDKLTVTWLNGDKIGLFNQVGTEIKNSNASFAITAASDITESGKKAVFGGELTQSADWDMDFYAYYPYNNSYNDAKAIPVSVADQVIDGKDSKHLAKYDVLVADPVKGVKAGAGNTALNFKHVVAVADLKISLPAGAASQDIKEIRIVRGDNKTITLSGTLDITAAADADRLKVNVKEADKSWAQFTKVENVKLAAGESFQARVALLPDDWSGDNVSIYVNTSEGTYQFDKTNIKTEAGKRYSSELKLEQKLVAKVGDFYYADGTWSTDLDANKKVVGIVAYTGQKGGATNGFVISLEDVESELIGKISRWNIPEIQDLAMTDLVAGTVEDWDGQAHARAVAAKRTEDGYKDMTFILMSVDYAPQGITSGPSAKGNWYTPAANQFATVNNHHRVVEASLALISATAISSKRYYTSTESTAIQGIARNGITVSINDPSTPNVISSARIDRERDRLPARPFLTF
ncbi:MAG: fimbrillin family protein [Sphingobacterium sp.]|jgi:hypothetical protein|nr:fimbrillin family protein [Sphingobacterium sp.]